MEQKYPLDRAKVSALSQSADEIYANEEETIINAPGKVPHTTQNPAKPLALD